MEMYEGIVITLDVVKEMNIVEQFSAKLDEEWELPDVKLDVSAKLDIDQA